MTKLFISVHALAFAIIHLLQSSNKRFTRRNNRKSFPFVRYNALRHLEDHLVVQITRRSTVVGWIGGAFGGKAIVLPLIDSSEFYPFERSRFKVEPSSVLF